MTFPPKIQDTQLHPMGNHSSQDTPINSKVSLTMATKPDGLLAGAKRKGAILELGVSKMAS